MDQIENSPLPENRLAGMAIALECLGTNSLCERAGGSPMPIYDYFCNDCRKSFELVLTLKEHDAEKIKCPKCGGKNVEQAAASFFAVTSKKS